MASGSGGDLDNSTIIQGGNDGTPIGNVGDRIKVDFSASPAGAEPIVPADSITYFSKFLLNGATVNQNVDGSTTPVVYSVGPSAGQTWYVTELLFLIQDGGTNDATDYGGIGGGLTNGTLVEHSRNGTDYEVATLMDNIDIAADFSDTALAGSPNGFLNDANLFIGLMKIEPEITLVGDDSDVVKFTVRDDLTPLTRQRGGIRAWRII